MLVFKESYLFSEVLSSNSILIFSRMEIRKRGHQNCWLLKVAHQLTVTAIAAKVLSSNSVLIFSRMEIIRQ